MKKLMMAMVVVCGLVAGCSHQKMTKEDVATFEKKMNVMVETARKTGAEAYVGGYLRLNGKVGSLSHGIEGPLDGAVVFIFKVDPSEAPPPAPEEAKP